MSGIEVIMGLFLIMFGFITYYLVPLALLFNQFGLFFFVMNFILTALSIGLVLMAVISMNMLQKLILNLLLCCCKRKDRVLKPIIERRLDSG